MWENIGKYSQMRPFVEYLYSVYIGAMRMGHLLFSPSFISFLKTNVNPMCNINRFYFSLKKYKHLKFCFVLLFLVWLFSVILKGIMKYLAMDPSKYGGDVNSPSLRTLCRLGTHKICHWHPSSTVIEGFFQLFWK